MTETEIVSHIDNAWASCITVLFKVMGNCPGPVVQVVSPLLLLLLLALHREKNATEIQSVPGAKPFHQWLLLLLPCRADAKTKAEAEAVAETQPCPPGL